MTEDPRPYNVVPAVATPEDIAQFKRNNSFMKTAVALIMGGLIVVAVFLGLLSKQIGEARKTTLENRMMFRQLCKKLNGAPIILPRPVAKPKPSK